jgi:hypothetical protein
MTDDKDGQPGHPQPPKKSQTRQRNFQIKTPCLRDEFNAIAAKADNAGMTRAAWSRNVMLGAAGPRAQRRPHPDKKLLIQILGQIGRVGGNINQIARNLNEGGQPQIPELKQAIKAYMDIRNAIYEALGMSASDKPTDDNKGNKPRQP